MSTCDSMLDYGFIFSPAIQVNSGIPVKETNAFDFNFNEKCHLRKRMKKKILGCILSSSYFKILS